MHNKDNTGGKLKRNLISGFASQLIIALLGIVMPRLVLVSYGSETNGLISSITQIYGYFELLEAGVGSATLQALFKWVGKDDGKDRVNQILSATSNYYNRVGTIYVLCMCSLAIIYPIVLSTDIPKSTIVLIILMQGIPSACSYFTSAKFKLLLTADGREYVKNNLSLLIKVFSDLAKISLILAGFQILAVQFAFFCLHMLQIVLYKIYERSEYRWVNYHVIPDYESISQKKNVFIHQISGLIFSNTDILMLTFFCGLKMVSVYTMYAMVLSIITSLINIFSSSFYFYLGQTFNTSREKYLKLHDIHETYFMSLVFTLYTVTYILLIPFIRLYTSGVSDINYIDPILPLLFVSIKFLEIGRAPSLNVLNFSMKFKETQHHAVIEMILNVVVSLVGAWFLGIYGVLLGTIIALLYRCNAMILYSNKRVLERTPLITYRRWGINILVFVLIAQFFNNYPINVPNFFSFIIDGIGLTLFVGIIYFGVISALEKGARRDLVAFIRLRFTK